jgi:threonine dehydrogenase-like Zn-dependent dehydrogenase
MFLIGRNSHKCSLVASHCQAVIITDRDASQSDPQLQQYENYFDCCIDTTGNQTGVATACKIVKALGCVVLKTTTACGSGNDVTVDASHSIAPSMFSTFSLSVIKEIKLVGSRCGNIERALDFMVHEKACVEGEKLDLAKFVQYEVPFNNAMEAFKMSKQKGVLKVQLVM